MMFLIDDDTSVHQITPSGYSTGLLPAIMSSEEDSEAITEADFPLIPMEEWPDRISDLESNHATLKHIWADSVIGVLDQGNLPYCHAFSPVVAMMILREAQGLPYVELSAGSVGGPVTNYRRRGAWIVDDLDRITQHGAATTEFVPMSQVSRSGWEPGADENCNLHRVLEWNKLKRRNFEQHASSLLTCQPTCVGLNYWGHAVTDLVLRDIYPSKAAADHGRYGVEFLNSWSTSWGDDGFGVRVGGKKFADEAYVPRRITSSVA